MSVFTEYQAEFEKVAAKLPANTARVPVRDVFVITVEHRTDVDDALELAANLHGRTGAEVIVLTRDMSLQSLDEHEMRLHGWVRPQRTVPVRIGDSVAPRAAWDQHDPVTPNNDPVTPNS